MSPAVCSSSKDDIIISSYRSTCTTSVVVHDEVLVLVRTSTSTTSYQDHQQWEGQELYVLCTIEAYRLKYYLHYHTTI
jgi:hypothetical protein